MLPRSSMLTSRLTTTLRSRQPLGAGREADRDDRGQQLRGQADRDREREQHRLQQRAAEHDVDRPGSSRPARGHADQQQREVAQAELEGGLRLALAEPHRDRAELRPRRRCRTTTPRPLPSRTTVPMKAHDASSSGDSGAVTGSLCFSAGSDSPVSTASSHSRPSASQQAQVRGHDVTDGKPHDVAGHELGDVDRCRLAVAHRPARCGAAASAAPRRPARSGTR